MICFSLFSTSNSNTMKMFYEISKRLEKYSVPIAITEENFP
jgi:hypothetical protein